MTAGDPERSLEQELRELRTINQLIGTLTSTLELPEILRIVLGRLKSLTQAEALSLMLYDAERDELVFAATETLRENDARRPALPAFAESWRAGSRAAAKAPSSNDVESDPRFYAEIDRATGFRTRSLLCVPLRRAGRSSGSSKSPIATMTLPFGETDRRRLEELAVEVGEACDPDSLCHDPRSDAHAPRPGRRRSCRARRRLSCSSIPPAASSCSAPRERCSPESSTGFACPPTAASPAGWRAIARPSGSTTSASDPRHFTGVEQQTGLVPRTMICVPMVSKEVLRGVIQIINKVDGSRFTEAELRLAQTLADHAAIAIENASLYRQAYLASITDDLTGLGNTRHFNGSLLRLIARGGPVSLIILDLDNFKAVVDGYGHLVGSRTIAQIGRMIGRLIRPGDVAARFGGDEFVIAMPDTDAVSASRLADGIRQAIEACHWLEGEDVDLSGVTASFGVATFPDNAQRCRELVSRRGRGDVLGETLDQEPRAFSRERRLASRGRTAARGWCRTTPCSRRSSASRRPAPRRSPSP